MATDPHAGLAWLPTLDRTSGIPCHVQIVQQTRAVICDGTLPAGALLPPEPDLAHQLSITRDTLRKAWGRCRRGRGTVVCGPT